MSLNNITTSPDGDDTVLIIISRSAALAAHVACRNYRPQMGLGLDDQVKAAELIAHVLRSPIKRCKCCTPRGACGGTLADCHPASELLDTPRVDYVEEREKRAADILNRAFDKAGSDGHTTHYGSADDPYEVIKVIEAWGLDADFCLGNAVKYLGRAGKKAQETLVRDLEKAVWYIQRRIKQLKGGA